jgi:hypothetical protein
VAIDDISYEIYDKSLATKCFGYGHRKQLKNETVGHRKTIRGAKRLENCGIS